MQLSTSQYSTVQCTYSTTVHVQYVTAQYSVHFVTSDLGSYNTIAAAAAAAGGGGGKGGGVREQNKAQQEQYKKNPYIQENLSDTWKRQRPYNLKLYQWF